MNGLFQDFRLGLRTLSKSPAFTAVAILTLALGIGANAAIFSVLDAVLLQPLPYSDGDRLVMVGDRSPDGGSPNNVGYATYEDLRDRNRTFAAMAAIRNWQPTLVTDGVAERIPAMRVTSNYFSLLGAQPALGRGFLPEEDRPDSWRVLLLSDGLWRRSFGADPSAVGRVVRMNDQSYRIVGVMPRDFQPLVSARYYKPAQLWAPIGYDRSLPSSLPQLPASEGHRPAGAGRLARAGPRRPRRRPLPAPGRVAVRLSGRRDGRGSPLEGADGRPSRSSPRPLRGGRVRPADRVRQRRQPDARALPAASARDGGPGGARRQPLAADPAAPRRKPRPLRGGRRRGARPRNGPADVSHPPRPGVSPAPGQHVDRPAGPRLRGPGLARCGPSLRMDSRAPRLGGPPSPLARLGIAGKRRAFVLARPAPADGRRADPRRRARSRRVPDGSKHDAAARCAVRFLPGPRDDAGAVAQRGRLQRGRPRRGLPEPGARASPRPSGGGCGRASQVRSRWAATGTRTVSTSSGTWPPIPPRTLRSSGTP